MEQVPSLAKIHKEHNISVDMIEQVKFIMICTLPAIRNHIEWQLESHRIDPLPKNRTSIPSSRIILKKTIPVIHGISVGNSS